MKISKIEIHRLNRRSGGPNGAAYYSNIRGISYYTVKGGRRQFMTNFTIASWTNGTVEISFD